jgi:hypothetical protein
MLVVRVTENVRAVQSSYYCSCPWFILATVPACLTSLGGSQQLSCDAFSTDFPTKNVHQRHKKLG